MCKLWLALALGILAVPSQAADSISGSLSGHSGAVRRLTPVLRDAIPTYQPPGLWITLGSGMAMQQEIGGWGIPISILSRVGHSTLFVGVDTGINFWEFVIPGQGRVRRTGVPVLPTLIYQSENATTDMLHPFLGISGGTHLMKIDNTVTPVLEVLIRAGVQFDMSNLFSLSLDTRFGMLGTQFVFFPQLSAGVSI